MLLEVNCLKIVHVEDYFDPSAGYQINELLYAGKDLKDEIYLVTSTDMTPFHKKVDISLDRKFERLTGVKIYRLKPVLKISTRLLLKDFSKTIKQINPDVVFMHGIGDFKDLQLWGKKPQYKVIRDCHMSWVASRNKFRYLYYFFFKYFFASIINRTNKYEVIFALGKEEYEYLKRLGIKDNKIDYLPHGYNNSIMHYDESERNDIRKRYKYGKEDIIISYIGKFDDFKRPDLILDIIDKFEKDYIDKKSLKLLFIGPKDYEYMKKFDKKLSNVKDKIDVVVDAAKPFSELRKYFSASDICIFPKGATLSSIHAQVCGCQVIMENHKSNRERVVNNDNLFEIDNLEQAARILRRIIDNEEFKNKQDQVLALKDREYHNQIEKLRSILAR
jgi:glycosyltransferase involved in cell wall biosynthesis